MFTAPEMPKNLGQNWQWGIEINGFEAAYFSKGKTPTINLNESVFNSAGSMFPNKVAGRGSFDDITFEKGLIADGTDKAALQWLQQEIDINTQTGGLVTEYMRDIDLIQFNRRGEEFRRWTLHGAWIKKYDGSDLDGGNDDATLEMLTICYQFASNSNRNGLSNGSRSLGDQITSSINTIFHTTF